MYWSITRSMLVTVAVAWFVLDHGGPAAFSTLAQSPARPTRFEIMQGTRASYRVREQLAGVRFFSDAVGVTEAVKGALSIRPDGTIDASQSRLTLDLRTLTSDQDRRDDYLRSTVLESEKFPQAVFVARTIAGSPWSSVSKTPFAIVSFQLLGSMTVHGVTKQISWDVVATYNTEKGMVEGKALTSFPFSTFRLTKPEFAFLLSVEDEIRLEVDFKVKTS